MNQREAIIGCLLGTAVGDAIGLHCEGLSKKRQKKLYPDIDSYHLVFGKGMTSDDTEHSCMLAQSLIASQGELHAFAKNFAWRLRWWLCALPAGIGYATLRSIIKLWLGFSPRNSGVFSAGNGPAMRVAILGVCYGDQPQKLKDLVRAATHITHKDPKAECGAIAIAIAAYMTSRSTVSVQDYREQCCRFLPPENDFIEILDKVIDSIEKKQNAEQFAQEMGLEKGISGYIYHSVPMVIHCWLRHQNAYQPAITEIIRCGGDTDTTAAILGAIIGTGVGKEGIPEQWRKDLIEWPRSISWIEQLGERLALSLEQKQKTLPLPIWGICLRNVLFFCIVIFHGVRRLFPPY